ncbi:hypothetical protein [Methanobacterium paludis]|uniref:Uncharacterized protein n=1 Tax=Methanobacterium paludis (strain DSM 25820 / JCM 18151 / SWAN1) TaxID=868131 RepID=F6D373_METPW|nr:hypothetical protein [Methanobacterium paludis]AEG18013.1 hypothetical protein MSWAN_0989 [Methanobacterium paludis]
MKSVENNAITIIKAMVEGSLKRANGDAIKRLTNLRSKEINDGILYLEQKNLVTLLPSPSPIRYDFLNVTIDDRAYSFYSDNYCGLSIE